MTKNLYAVMVAIVTFCAVQSANAQYYCYDRGGLFEDGVSFYAGFGAGAALVNETSAPAFSVRIGADAGMFLGEIEAGYLSINSVYDEFDGVEKNMLSTVTIGANLGLKFVNASSGYLAVMLYAGYSLQENWRRGGHHGGHCNDFYYCYQCDDYYDSHSFHGKHYIGVGVNGAIDLSSRVALFGEARYQSIPIDGRGETKWGAVLQGGLKFYF